MCGCDGICRCGEGYSGTNCECTSDTESCIAPPDRNTVRTSKKKIIIIKYIYMYNSILLLNMY